MKLGEILIENKLVDENTISQALRVQVDSNRRLGDILVRMKAISADKLAETLATQFKIPICAIDDHFSEEARSIIPRYLCRNYGVMPLQLKENNILELAMANPSDDEAKQNIENYTGKVVIPRLAKLSDIEREIPQRIALSRRDIFSPQVNTKLTRAGIGICFILLTTLGYFTWNYVQRSMYGTQAITDKASTYTNHDLIVGFEKDGLIHLSGHGAYATGYYSIKFSNLENLKGFITRKKEDMSQEQRDWLNWVVGQEQQNFPKKALAKAN